MRLPKSFIVLVATTIALIPSILAVFVDEAYHVDYHHQLLGIPQPHTTFFHRPRKDEKASLLYTLSDQGVLGAVNPGTGAIVWRHLVLTNSTRTFGGEDGIQGFLRAAEGEGTVVSAVESHVNAWDATTGRERWNNHFEGWVRDLEVMETASNEAHKDSLVLFEHAGKGVVRRLGGATGDVVWEYALEGSDLPFQVSTNVKSVFVLSLHGARGGYNIKVTTLDPVTGKRVDEHTLASKADVHGHEDVIFVGANIAAPIVAWTDKSMKVLKVNILGTKQILSLSLTAGGEEVEKVIIHAPHLIQSQPHFLVHTQSATSHWAEVYHIDIVAVTITEAYHLPKLPGQGAFSTSSQEANVYFTRHTGDEVIVVSSASHGVLGKWPLSLEEGTGAAIHGVSEVIHKTSKSYAVRSAILTTEYRWDMIRNGVPAWRRYEGLSGAVAAAWAEIPEEEDLAKTLKAEAHSSPLAAYIHRVRRHANDLQYLPEYLQTVPKRFLSSINGGSTAKTQNGPLTKDSFGFRKLVIVATEHGQLYALDTANQGKIIWSRKAYDIPAGDKWDVKGMLVDNVNGTAIIKSADGSEFTFKTVTGAALKTRHGDPMYAIQSTAAVDSPSGQKLLSVDARGISISEDGLPPNFGVVVRGEHGEVKGLTPTKDPSTGANIEAWTFQPPKGQKILSVISRPTRDPVASIGRVMSDRSVMYKYLNPNLILITAVSESASMAFFYLLDSVSGAVLYSTTHDAVDVNQPITSLLTENWFVYSLWADATNTPTSSQSFKGYQIVVSELYESPLTNDRGPLGASGNYSSLEPSQNPSDEPALPHIIAQSFLIPEAISHMSVTQTRQGITSRQLLCTLPLSHAIIGIPRQLLDPRRPVGRDPTPGEMEEGLSKYNPVIEFDPKMIITHQREVYGIRNVITSPALLESTSLVFAYGIDMFGTRMTPSQAFDLLGKDFNRLALVVSVVALSAGVGVLAPMVRRKQINGRWQTA